MKRVQEQQMEQRPQALSLAPRHTRIHGAMAPQRLQLRLVLESIQLRSVMEITVFPTY